MTEQPITMVYSFVRSIADRGGRFQFTDEGFTVEGIALSESEQTMCDMLRTGIIANRATIKYLMARHEPGAVCEPLKGFEE